MAARTNLAAQMGFGSNPNLHSLDQLQTQLPNREQLTWQQQLLAQQQQQQPYESYGNQGLLSGGFHSHHGHHLPAVPTWQNSASGVHQHAALGQLGQNPTAPGGSPGWNSGQSNQDPYAMHTSQYAAGQGTLLPHPFTHSSMLHMLPASFENTFVITQTAIECVSRCRVFHCTDV